MARPLLPPYTLTHSHIHCAHTRTPSQFIHPLSHTYILCCVIEGTGGWLGRHYHHTPLSPSQFIIHPLSHTYILCCAIEGTGGWLGRHYHQAEAAGVDTSFSTQGHATARTLLRYIHSHTHTHTHTHTTFIYTQTHTHTHSHTLTYISLS